MADNTTIDPGNTPSVTVATDEVSGVHFQKVKLYNSTPDSTTEVGTDSYPLPVQHKRAATPTRSQVADTTSEGVLLAANSNRLGASIQNTSSGVLYVGAGTTAVTTTNFTVRLAQWEYWEPAAGYTGVIRGLWASDPNDGYAMVTEYTP